jgi:alpha-tubulin suppressor-like RCC1 family protein
VSGLTGVTAIAGGDLAGYALRSDGTVWAWGYNGYGELGNGTLTESSVPVQVSGLTGVTAITGGDEDGYALRSDGTLWAWGWNGGGELGDGTTTDNPSDWEVDIAEGAGGWGGPMIPVVQWDWGFLQW